MALAAEHLVVRPLTRTSHTVNLMRTSTPSALSLTHSQRRTVSRCVSAMGLLSLALIACKERPPAPDDLVSLTPYQLHLLLSPARVMFFDHEGRWERLVVDQGGDGRPERALVRHDKSGSRPAELWEDRDGDGRWDYMLEDTDVAGGYDAGRRDMDHDGFFDQRWDDASGDGVPQDSEWKGLAVPEEVADQQLMSRLKH